MQKNEQKELLKKAGFKNISLTQLTYAGQSYLDKGFKL